MNTKRIVLFLVFIALAVSGVFAQDAQLPQGRYRSLYPHYFDVCLVTPNSTYDPQQVKKIPQSGYYTFEFANSGWVKVTMVGQMRGNKIQARIVWSMESDRNIGSDPKFRIGNTFEITVIPPQSFEAKDFSSAFYSWSSSSR